MSAPPPTSELYDDDKPSSLVTADVEQLQLTPKLEAISQHNVGVGRNAFLSAPLTAPIRPLSPDTLSILSVEEYEQLRPQRLFQQPTSLPAASPRGWRAKWDAYWKRNLGLAYMLIAQVFGTLMNVTTRLLEVEGNNGKGMHPMQILFARMGLTLVLATIYMWWVRTPHFPFGAPEVRWLLVIRGFSGFFGVFGMYFSLLYLPLADATVITFLAPGLACWACSFLINEPYTRIEKIGTLVSLLGVVLIARPASLFHAMGSSPTPPASGTGDMTPAGNNTASPGHDSDASSYENVTPLQRLGAVGVALVGVMGAVGAYTTIRWIGKRAHPLISVNYFAAWSTFVAVVGMLVLPGVGFILPATPKEWAYLIFLGVCGFVMQFLLASALAYEKSSRTTNMIYTQMLFALGFDKLIFGHSPGLLSILGSSLILGSAVVVAVQKTSTPSEIKEVTLPSMDDEESRTGLISGVADRESGEDHERERGGQAETVEMRQLG